MVETVRLAMLEFGASMQSSQVDDLQCRRLVQQQNLRFVRIFALRLFYRRYLGLALYLKRKTEFVQIFSSLVCSSPYLFAANMDCQNGHDKRYEIRTGMNVDEFNDDGPAKPRLATSRAQSPCIQQPAIDFDGLSWPSK